MHFLSLQFSWGKPNGLMNSQYRISMKAVIENPIAHPKHAPKLAAIYEKTKIK